MNTSKRFLMTTMAVGSIVLIALLGGQAQKCAAQTSDPTSTNAAAPVEMKQVNGELVGKLDSKSAKTGDSVEVKTTESEKMATGTEIPKGSKLMGTVTAVKPHTADNANAEMGIRFDHAELKGGQSVPIQSLIQSIALSSSDAASNPANNAPAVMGTPMGGAQSAGAGTMAASRPSGPTGSSAADQSINGMGPGQSSATGTNNTIAPGAVVGKLGSQPIRTTSVPGVLLASNTPTGASKLSGVFVGANGDVKLSGGTQLVLQVATASAQ